MVCSILTLRSTISVINAYFCTFKQFNFLPPEWITMTLKNSFRLEILYVVQTGVRAEHEKLMFIGAGSLWPHATHESVVPPSPPPHMLSMLNNVVVENYRRTLILNNKSMRIMIDLSAVRPTNNKSDQQRLRPFNFLLQLDQENISTSHHRKIFMIMENIWSLKKLFCILNYSTLLNYWWICTFHWQVNSAKIVLVSSNIFATETVISRDYFLLSELSIRICYQTLVGTRSSLVCDMIMFC